MARARLLRLELSSGLVRVNLYRTRLGTWPSKRRRHRVPTPRRTRTVYRAPGVRRKWRHLRRRLPADDGKLSRIGQSKIAYLALDLDPSHLLEREFFARDHIVWWFAVIRDRRWSGHVPVCRRSADRW